MNILLIKLPVFSCFLLTLSVKPFSGFDNPECWPWDSCPVLGDLSWRRDFGESMWFFYSADQGTMIVMIDGSHTSVAQDWIPHTNEWMKGTQCEIIWHEEWHCPDRTWSLLNLSLWHVAWASLSPEALQRILIHSPGWASRICIALLALARSAISSYEWQCPFHSYEAASH